MQDAAGHFLRSVPIVLIKINILFFCKLTNQNYVYEIRI